MGLMGCLYWGNLHICGILASIKATQHGVEPDPGVASDSYMKIETSHSSLKLKKYSWSGWRDDLYNRVRVLFIPICTSQRKRSLRSVAIFLCRVVISVYVLRPTKPLCLAARPCSRTNKYIIPLYEDCVSLTTMKSLGSKPWNSYQSIC